MKYSRTKDRIITSNIATHKLTKSICCGGYLKTLEKGSLCKIGKTWTNFYGYWTTILDEKGNHYDIRPYEVEEVVEELEQCDTIEELCDEFVLYYLPLEEMSNNESWIPYAQYERLGVWQKMRDEIVDKTLKSKSTLYGAIWTDKGLIYVAKMNDKGELELL